MYNLHIYATPLPFKSSLFQITEFYNHWHKLNTFLSIREQIHL
jgi:hypothetical protein